jgi:hypothetical protein
MSTPFYDLASLVVVPSGYKTSKVYAQKPQTTDGQLAFTRSTTATRVNSAGLIEEVAINVPRLDYLNSTCPRLLLEPQRVNLALFSESLDNAYWTNAEATTVSANVGVSPDGYTNADKLIPQATSNFHRLSRSFTVTTATPYTFSAFVKRAGYDYFLIRTSDAGNNNIGYDLLNGTVTYTASGYTSFIESYGNDWYRIGFVRSFTASTITINFRPNPTAISTNALDNFTGDGTSGGFVWGTMLELGSYATSYVNTLNSAVTRGADDASKTGIASLIGQTEGTLFLEFTIGRTPASTDRVAILSDGTGSERIGISLGGTGLLYMFVVDGGATQAEIIRTGTTAGTYKVAAAYKANDFVFYVNGVQVGTDTAGTIPSCSRLDIGNQLGVGQLGGGVNQALLFTTRLTNAQLAELTTI